MADTLQTAGITVGIGAAVYLSGGLAVGALGTGTALSLEVSHAGLATTIGAANAGRVSASAINISANLVAQASRAHAWNVLGIRTLNSIVVGGALSGMHGGFDGFAANTIGTVGDSLISPGSNLGPGSLLVNAANIIAPLAESMNQRANGQSVPGLGVNNRLQQGRLSRSASEYDSAVGRCYEKFFE